MVQGISGRFARPLLSALSCIALSVPAELHAQQATAATPRAVLQTDSPMPQQSYCATPDHHALDFLEGDWLVYEKGELMAFAHVEKRGRGCFLVSENKWVNDKYRRPGQSFRFEGYGVYAFSNGEWKVFALDIMGGAFLLRGRRVAEGRMEFIATEPRYGVYIRASYEKLPNGDIRSSAESSPDGRTGWKPTLDYLYKPNH